MKLKNEPANDNAVSDVALRIGQEIMKMGVTPELLQDAADILHDSAPNKDIKKVALVLLFAAEAMQEKKPFTLDIEGVFHDDDAVCMDHD